VVLYEAATGRRPFDGPSLISIMHEIAAVDPPPPSTIEQSLPPEFDSIVARLLAKERGKRCSSASELIEGLRELESATAASPFRTPTAGNTSTESEREVFVGRELEMRSLEAMLSQAVAGSGRIVFITGEPGIGKTTLCDEFLRHSHTQHVTLLPSRGRCVEQYGTGEPYLPFLDAVGSLLAGPGRERVRRVLRTYAPTWCLQLPAFISSGDLERLQRETVGASKERMLREMADALGVLAAGAPLLILLEDLHWADPSSTDLLRHLSRAIGGQRLLIVGTLRPEDLEISNHPLKSYKLEMQAHNLCEELALGSLSDDHIAAYLDARFAPNDFPHELSELIRRKTEGHPLFATSLVRFLARRGDIARVNERWSVVRSLAEMDLEPPQNVISMIRKKTEALEEDDKRALQYASVEGEEFISTVVACLLGTDDLSLEERLDRLDKVHRLIDTRGEEELPDGTWAMRYRFAHALYQNVFYDDLVSKRRTLLHRQAGERLIEHYGDQRSRVATQLAMHFERGRDFSRAIEYLIQAGDNALNLYANAEAEEHYTHALRLGEDLSGVLRTARYLTLYQKRGTANLALTRLSRAEDDFTRMLELARSSGAMTSECAALNALANTFFFAHRLPEMGSCAEEAIRVADRIGDRALKVEAMVQLAMKHSGCGDLAECKLLLDEAIPAARSLKHGPALLGGLIFRGLVHFFQTEYDRAEALLTEAVNLASNLRDGFRLLLGRFFLGLSRGNLGRMSEALEALLAAREMALRNGNHLILARVPNALGWIHRELGDVTNAVSYDLEGVELARQHRLTEAEANSLINLGHDYIRCGEREKTATALLEAESIFERDDWHRWRFHHIRFHAGAAEHWLSQGELERAGEHARLLLENATRHQVPKYIAVAHKLLAEAAAARGQFGEAEAELNAAIAQLRSHSVPILAWKIYGALGRLRLKMGMGQLARESLAQAAAIINTIAASITDERLRSVFLNSQEVLEALEEAANQMRPSPPFESSS
jgi:tetratricopeptide (TPR) repeat protein